MTRHDTAVREGAVRHIYRGAQEGARRIPVAFRPSLFYHRKYLTPLSLSLSVGWAGLLFDRG